MPALRGASANTRALPCSPRLSHSYELRYGAALRDDADGFWARIAGQILPLVTWLPVMQAEAERAGMVAAGLRRVGRPCGSIDPLLAATALEHGLTLVTRNTRHFAAVPGISLENWFTAP